jgi:hypothetical protein
MQTIRFEDGTVITIKNRVIRATEPAIEELANTLLKGTYGKFNNDEIYPNRDLAIKEFLLKELGVIK